MNEKMREIKEKIEAQIDLANVSEKQKDIMRRSLQAMFMAQNGRLYLQRLPDFQQYLTIAQNKNSGNYEICLVKKMINEFSGSIEGADYQFPGLVAVADIIEERRDIIESEIVNAQNFRRMEERAKNGNEGNKAAKSKLESYTENAKQAIEEDGNIPSYQKQRAYDIMDLLAELPVHKIYSEHGENYSRAISLRETNSGYNYCILTRMFDEYSGATINRDSTTISAVRLARYINDHRVELDKTVKEIRRNLPKKATNDNREAKTNNDDAR